LVVRYQLKLEPEAASSVPGWDGSKEIAPIHPGKPVSAADQLAPELALADRDVVTPINAG
jgi:hypothetical protein